jgi:hypothetical protein
MKYLKMNRPRAAIFLTLILTCWELSGQINENGLDQQEDLSLRIKSICFIKNNEYYSPVIEGYTLPGFFFQPELVYSPSEKIILRAGAHLLKYSGTKKFSQVKPVFSTTINLSEKTMLTIGSLSGSEKHQMFDPHFNKERLYNAYLEDGFQLTTITSHFFNDVWLSWENFIFKGDSTREVFTFGESFRYKSTPVSDFMEFEIPFQFQFKHFGGQISNYPEHVETFFNLAAGLRINFNLQNKRYGQAGLEYLQFLNNQLNGVPEGGISHGYASWMRLHYTYKFLYICASYWKSHDFFAPDGDGIYSSVSDYQNIIVPDRKIITNTFSINILPESYVELFLGFDTYYYVDLKRLDNAVTLHLNFDKLIRLATIKH